MSEAIDRGVEPGWDSVDPADAFAILGNELRLEILRALWAAPDEPMAFSELYREVDVDDSAQFNYHLEKLTDHFVHRSDDGYTLRRAGEKVVQAVLAGSFTHHPRRIIAMDDPCIQCGDPLEAVYDDEVLAISCPSCGHGHGEYPFPPGGLTDRTDEEILEAFDQRLRHLHCLAKDGVCPECNGKMHSRFVEDSDCCLGASIRVDHRCEQCNHDLCSALGLGLLDNAAVVSFYRDQGLDLSNTPYWRLPWCVSDDPIRILSRDPWEIQVTLEGEDATLQVVLDEHLEIVKTNH